MLPLQPERQERPQTGEFGVPVHCPIPITELGAPGQVQELQQELQELQEQELQELQVAAPWRMRRGDGTGSRSGRFTFPPQPL